MSASAFLTKNTYLREWPNVYVAMPRAAIDDAYTDVESLTTVYIILVLTLLFWGIGK